MGGIICILAFVSLRMALGNQAEWIASGQWTQSDFTMAMAFLIALGAIGFIFFLWGFFEVRR